MSRVIEDRAMELVKDLTIKIAWDSFQSGKLSIKRQGLIDRAIAHGLYIFIGEEFFTMKVQNMAQGAMLKAVSGVVGKTAMDIIVRMIRGKKYSLQTIILSNVIGEVIGYGWDMAMGMNTPSNGNVKVTAGPRFL